MRRGELDGHGGGGRGAGAANAEPVTNRGEDPVARLDAVKSALDVALVASVGDWATPRPNEADLLHALREVRRCHWLNERWRPLADDSAP